MQLKLFPAALLESELFGREKGASTGTGDAERTHILGVLKETNWIVGGRDGAAARLGVPRTTLIGRMQKLGISSRQGGLPLDRTRNAPQLFAS